jgi:DNA-binding IclR family transcriptional regulator
MEPSAPSYHSQGLLRAIAILHALNSGDGPQSLAQLSRTLDLPKSTLMRLLVVLESEGFVYKEGDPPVYTVGHAVLDIANSVRNRIDVTKIVSPRLSQLARDSGLTANVGVLEGHSVLHLCVEEPDRPLRYRSSSGSLDSAYCTGLGKMLLSSVSEPDLVHHVPAHEPYPSFTPGTITTRKDLVKDLTAIRNRGYSIDDQERDLGVVCLAAPIALSEGLNVAISVSGPAAELQGPSEKRCFALLNQAAEDYRNNSRFLSAIRESYPTARIRPPDAKA